MTTPSRIVIVGGGHGGAAAAAMLRQSGYAGKLVLLGDERHPPYHRPPLSKKFGLDAAHQPLRPPEFYRDNDIDLRLGISIAAIDRDTRRLQLADTSHGSDSSSTDSAISITYDILILATGSSPRSLPGSSHPHPRILTLRGLDDASALGDILSRREPLAIIGGGYIGLEVAAVARSLDIPVTIVERESRVLARVASPEFSAILSDYHRARDTHIIENGRVERVRTLDEQVLGVDLADGQSIAAQAVLVGIGAQPNDGLAVTAGLECDGGILVNHEGRTSDPSVFALGDVTRRPVAGHDSLVRLESIPNVTEQSRQIASAIIGTEAPTAEVPWFWSDQFELKLKIAGLLHDHTRAVRRDGKKPNSHALFHLNAEGVVTSIETCNAPGDFVAGKRFIAQQTRVDPLKLADASVSLRDVQADASIGSAAT